MSSSLSPSGRRRVHYQKSRAFPFEHVYDLILKGLLATVLLISSLTLAELHPIHRAVEHFEEKLYKLGSMMKTETGKEMAQRRTTVLRDFAEEWKEEASLSFEFY